MRKLIQSYLTTIDGAVDNPASWQLQDYADDASSRDAFGQVSACGAMLWGRTTYEYFSRVFPQRSDEWATRVNTMKKYVFSSTLQTADWDNSTIIRADAAAAVAKLKDEEGGDLLIYGRTQLAETLRRAGLVDVVDVAVYPILAGGSSPVLRDGPGNKLKLIATKSYAKGVVKLTYEPQ